MVRLQSSRIEVPPSTMVFAGRSHPALARSIAEKLGVELGAEKVPLECFQPEKEERIFILGGCADVSREAAAALLRQVLPEYYRGANALWAHVSAKRAVELTNDLRQVAGEEP